jgi:hypothetical protein
MYGLSSISLRELDPVAHSAVEGGRRVRPRRHGAVEHSIAYDDLVAAHLGNAQQVRKVTELLDERIRTLLVN